MDQQTNTRLVWRKNPQINGGKEGIMKKIIIILLLLSSCSEYIIDPRASKQPKEIIRDEIECDKLIKENVNSVIRWLDYDLLMRKCLSNRGHSIIN